MRLGVRFSPGAPSLRQLPEVQIFTGRFSHAAQMKATLQECLGLPMSALIGFFVFSKKLNLVIDKSADGGSSPACQLSQLV
jgi:hypothetical protein